MREWVCKPKSGFGSADRVQRNAYAWRVTMMLTADRSVCPCCERPITADNAEVDRTIPINDERGRVYRQGYVVYVCRNCNEQRGILQSQGLDWNNVNDYIEDVRHASEFVSMPTAFESREWWDNRNNREGPISRYA